MSHLSLVKYKDRFEACRKLSSSGRLGSCAAMCSVVILIMLLLDRPGCKKLFIPWYTFVQLGRSSIERKGANYHSCLSIAIKQAH